MPARAVKKGSRTIQVDYLARVEGEGSLTIRFERGRAKEVELRIFEPPRFFEAFLRGRSMFEAPDITARICGICPVAYQMSACQAMEKAAGVTVDSALRKLRRLLYCGEWIESHALHTFMLHAPDFLGYPDALAMARDHPEWVRRGLRMKKGGNAIITLLGGREIHPINVRLGGFYRVPPRAAFRDLLDELKWGRDAAHQTVRWMAGFDFPDFTRDYEFVALRPPREYPLCEGRLVSNRGLDIAVEQYDEHFEELQVRHSTALHSVIRGRGEYLVGPLARFNLNFDRLCEVAKEAARDAHLPVPCLNPFMSLPIRAVETLQAFDEAVRIIENFEAPDRPFVEVPRRAGVGYGCTEAPRGVLYHRYRVDEQGIILEAKIVPPTSQNQRCMEADLLAIAPKLAEMPHEQATWRAEQTIRNYDPCVSCSTHFLRLKIEGRP